MAFFQPKPLKSNNVPDCLPQVAQEVKSPLY